MGHRIFVGRDEHKFSAAHMTVFPDGTKERLHGHNYQVRVALDLASVSEASFLDLGIVKEAMRKLCRAWNERLLLAEANSRLEILRRTEEELEFRLCGKRYVVPADEVLFLAVDNVVLENLTSCFADGLIAEMAPHLARGRVTGIEVEVQELPGQGGIHYREL